MIVEKYHIDRPTKWDKIPECLDKWIDLYAYYKPMYDYYNRIWKQWKKDNLFLKNNYQMYPRIENISGSYLDITVQCLRPIIAGLEYLLLSRKVKIR